MADAYFNITLSGGSGGDLLNAADYREKPYTGRMSGGLPADFSNAGKNIENINKGLERQNSIVQKSSRTWREFGRSIQGTHLTLTKFYVVMNRVLFALVSFKIINTAISAVSGFTSQIIKGNAQMEVMNSQLLQYVGNMNDAARARRWIVKEAITTPYEIPDLVRGMLTLKSFGASMTEYGRIAMDTAAAQIAFGKTTASLGEQLNTTAEQMGRILIGGQNVRKTLSALRADIPTYVKVLGQTHDRGKALQAALEKFRGFSEKLSQTVIGKISNINDLLGIFARRMSALTFEEIKKDVDRLFKTLQNAPTTKIDQMGIAMKRTYTDLKNIGAGIGKLASQFSKLGISVRDLITSFALLMGLRTGLQFIINIFAKGGWIGATIGIIGTALTMLIVRMDAFGKANEQLKSDMGELTEFVNNKFPAMKKVGLENFNPDVLENYSIMLRGLTANIDVMAEKAKTAGGFWGKAQNFLFKIINLFIKFYNWIRPLLDVLIAGWGYLIKLLAMFGTGIAELINLLIQFGNSMTSFLIDPITEWINGFIDMLNLAIDALNSMFKTIERAPAVKAMIGDFQIGNIDKITDEARNKFKEAIIVPEIPREWIYKTYGAISDFADSMIKFKFPKLDLLPIKTAQDYMDEFLKATGMTVEQWEKFRLLVLDVANQIDKSAGTYTDVGKAFTDMANTAAGLKVDYRDISDTLKDLYNLHQEFNLDLADEVTLRGLLEQFYRSDAEKQQLTDIIASFRKVIDTTGNFKKAYADLIVVLNKKAVSLIKTLPDDVYQGLLGQAKYLKTIMSSMDEIGKAQGLSGKELDEYTQQTISNLNDLKGGLDQIMPVIAEMADKGILPKDSPIVLEAVAKEMEKLVGQTFTLRDFYDSITGADEKAQNLYSNLTALIAPIENMWSTLIDGAKNFGQVMKDIGKQILVTILQLMTRITLLYGMFKLIPSLIPKVMPGLSKGFSFGDIFGLLTGLAFLQGGGTARANQPVVVGERGAELFVPKQTGRVYSHEQLVGMLKGETQIVVPVTIEGREVARAVYNYNKKVL